MARRSGLIAALARAGREAARQQRLAEAARQRKERERLRCEREQLRFKAQMEKATRQQYLASRAAEASELTSESCNGADALLEILQGRSNMGAVALFDSLLLKEDNLAFNVPAELVAPLMPPRRPDFMMRVKPPSLLEKLFSSKERYERDLLIAERLFAEAEKQHAQAAILRQEKIRELETAHAAANEQHLTEIRARNAEVAELNRAYQVGEKDAVIALCSMVLEKSKYPEGFPDAFRLAYLPDPKELIIDYELPTLGVVPPTVEFRYNKTKDTIEERIKETGRDQGSLPRCGRILGIEDDP